MGKFLGTPLSLTQIQGVVHQLWGQRNKVDVIDRENSTFLFKFENSLSRSWVLDGGSWFVAQQPLLLKRWVPGLSFENLSSSKNPFVG